MSRSPTAIQDLCVAWPSPGCQGIFFLLESEGVPKTLFDSLTCSGKVRRAADTARQSASGDSGAWSVKVSEEGTWETGLRIGKLPSRSIKHFPVVTPWLSPGCFLGKARAEPSPTPPGRWAAPEAGSHWCDAFHSLHGSG